MVTHHRLKHKVSETAVLKSSCKCWLGLDKIMWEKKKKENLVKDPGKRAISPQNKLLSQPMYRARRTVTKEVVLSETVCACNTCNHNEALTWDLVACRQHWHPSPSSGQHRWCPRVHQSRAPHYYLQPTAQHLQKKKKKKVWTCV